MDVHYGLKVLFHSFSIDSFGKNLNFPATFVSFEGSSRNEALSKVRKVQGGSLESPC